MTLAERAPAAREATAAIAMLKRAPQRRRNGPRPGADLGDPAICVVAHHDPARIAREALRRFRRNIRAALEHGLARRLGVYQHRGVDVDHDLIALAWSPRIDSPVEGCLGDQRERVRLLLLHGGCFWGTIHVLRSRGTAHGVRPPWPLMSRLPGRRQSRQRAEGTGRADALPGRARVEADTPRQPRSA